MVTSKTENFAPKIPLKWRLKAWWKGYDVSEIEERIRLHEQEKNAATKKKNDPSESIRESHWDEASVRITQMVWGDGFCGPGGPDNIIAISKLLALSPKMSALVIEAGLGGPARVLAHEFGVWINGTESNELLAQEGMRMSITAGMEKKAPIIHCNPVRPHTFDRKFDRAFSKDSLYTVEDKVKAIKNVYDQLKDDALFLCSDYVLKDLDCLSHPDVMDWIRFEPQNPYPVTTETMVHTMENMGFRIRVNEDITEHYLEMVNEAWENAAQIVSSFAEDDENGSQNMQAILKEADLWNRRTKILRSGKLRVYRYLAHKPPLIL